MNVKMGDGRLHARSLYEIAINVVYQNFINNANFDIKTLPDPIIFDLISQCYKNVNYEKLLQTFDIIVLIRLLKFEQYRSKLMKFYQRLINSNYPIGDILTNDFLKMSVNIVDLHDNDCIIRHIYRGLRLSTFLSEASWYKESEQILKITKNLSCLLPNTIDSCKIVLECCHRLFHTLTMYFKFYEAAVVFNEISSITSSLKRCGEHLNYALLYTEFSRYSFFKNNYEESFKWIKKAMSYLHPNIAISIQIQVLRQASKVCAVKRDFSKAKFLMHQALARAEQYYGSGYYKHASLLLDFGFYLLNSDNIEQSASVYEEAYKLRIEMFDSKEKNLLVAIAEEDLAYALYVLEYSTGYFVNAMEYAEKAIKAMKLLLPAGNLMLSSANRVKALILEEMALDYHLDENNKSKLEEAEILHRDALSLTKDTFGEENILTAKHYGNLGRLYQSMKKFPKAEYMHLKAIQIKENLLGPDDYEVALSVGHLASLYNYHMKEYKKAEKLYYRSININLKLFSESYSGLEYDYRGLVHVYDHLGDIEQKLKFSSKLNKWNSLRNQYLPDVVGPDFYRVLNVISLKNVVEAFETLSTAEFLCASDKHSIS